MLRLVVSGVPLMSAMPASASLAASSAYRAARNDSVRAPDNFVYARDGWIRRPASIVPIVAINATDTQGQFDAYAVTVGTVVSYFRRSDLSRIDMTQYRVAGLPSAVVYALVQFQSSTDGPPYPVAFDPARRAGSGGIQGLHYSSWHSITGARFSNAGYGQGV
jgi:hypothetical protein